MRLKKINTLIQYAKLKNIAPNPFNKNKQEKIGTTKDLYLRKSYWALLIIFFLIILGNVSDKVSPMEDVAALFIVWLVFVGSSIDSLRFKTLKERIPAMRDKDYRERLSAYDESILKFIIRKKSSFIFAVFLILLSLDGNIHIIIKAIFIWILLAIRFELNLYKLIDQLPDNNKEKLNYD